MTPDHAALSAFLGRAYAAQFMQREPMAAVVAEFREAVAGDPALAADARAEAARLAPVPDGRCIVTKTHKAFLKQALES